MNEKPERRRTFVAVAFVAVVLVVLSGCVGTSGAGDDVALGQDSNAPSNTTTSVQTTETPTGSDDTTPTAAGSESDADGDSQTGSGGDAGADTETPTTETPSEDDSNTGQTSGGSSSGADDSSNSGQDDGGSSSGENEDSNPSNTATESTTTTETTTTECEPTYAVDPVEARDVEPVGVRDGQWTVAYGEVYNYWAYDVIDEGDIVLDVTLLDEGGEEVATKQEIVGDLRGVESTQFAVAFDVDPDRVDRAYATWTVDRQRWIDALCDGDG